MIDTAGGKPPTPVLSVISEAEGFFVDISIHMALFPLDFMDQSCGSSYQFTTYWDIS
jgi:hypothetical protein